MHKNTTTAALIVAMYVVAAYFAIQMVSAAPTGATITYNATAGTPSTTAENRTDARGTITTIILDAVQQDQYWKGYVGNISGRLSLDDASGNTIYDWPISATKQGEVYISRYSSPAFSNVSCADVGNVTVEHDYYGMTSVQSDNINKTFNATVHQTFLVGSQTITGNSCRSTATYVNDSAQSLTGTHYFQEILLMDSSQRLIYTTIVNASSQGFDNAQYDFQIIVPESAVNASTTYYFFTELG